MADAMSKGGSKRFPTHHGYGEVNISRYVVLYVSQLAWLGLGLYLYAGAYWPSTCTPVNLLEIYQCSPRLPETRGWREAALMTWLWSTPILIALEILRWVKKDPD
ncbi:hypothetical protein BMF35_a0390 [Aurantiacibacter gangjinensis]|uniref:Uncharacterized protein n=2 Tax=Aurantiacibacter gangjinensis TaxID=502682 RepID=A0A0G9MPV9_9SPHN|nr:hypothetical protein BMF35_a0390 [Aurantiacibacter gangjinensis]KLE31343.1 hypothetical protein AAW01_06960 [Aurantiacibacter gangjinensis]